MAETMYAWSRILYGAETDDNGNVLGPKAFEVNDSVSQDDTGADDEQWESWVNDGVVREVKMPEGLQDPTASPRQLMQLKLIDAQEGFNMSGPTEDLLRRFDDEGELVPEETEEIKAPARPPSAPSGSSGTSDS
jgi:hypothetical protein